MPLALSHRLPPAKFCADRQVDDQPRGVIARCDAECKPALDVVTDLTETTQELDLAPSIRV
ncbi:hypothetical protein [Sphingomonas faeni]|uniref:hypothetical protein n=1 Tax=Sphingomonas faeni TaxID=185950 RepID=UPI00335795DC